MVLQQIPLCELADDDDDFQNAFVAQQQKNGKFRSTKLKNSDFSRKTSKVNNDPRQRVISAIRNGVTSSKTDDAGYNSACSSLGLPLEEAAYIVEQTLCVQQKIDGGNLDSSSDGEFTRRQAQAFQESFNSFLELTADDKTTDESSGDQNLSANGQLDNDVAELVQLQRQLAKNSNQLTRINQRLKSTAGICEREIKEIKTFLLCLDRRNTDLIKKTTKTRTELYEKVKNLEDDVRFIKMDQKELPSISEKLAVFEKQQMAIEDEIESLREPVRRNNKELMNLLSRFPTDDNMLSPFNLNKQMDDMERRLTKGFFAFFFMLIFVAFSMTYWMQRSDPSGECIAQK